MTKREGVFSICVAFGIAVDIMSLNRRESSHADVQDMRRIFD